MRLFADVASGIADPFLRRAYKLAKRGCGTTSPNPMVGCVIVTDGRVVGEGYHVRAGESHAEVIALADAGLEANGATVYVTLEPCNHHGRTRACTQALADAGIAKVVAGMPDPNPDVAGGGADALRAASIEVEFAADPAPFEILNEAWLTWLATKMPFVQVKVALSLDGHASLAPERRAAITGEGARGITMRLRAAADAVVVGASTARTDDPALAVRDEEGEPTARQPLRIVLCRSEIPDVSLWHDGLGETAALLPESLAADAPAGLRVIPYPNARGLAGAFDALGQHGCVRVLVEAGPRLFGVLWEEELADELVVLHAGGLVGADAPPLYVAAPLAGEWLARPMRAVEAGVAGEDAVTVWRRSDRAGAIRIDREA